MECLKFGKYSDDSWEGEWLTFFGNRKSLTYIAHPIFRKIWDFGKS